MLKDKTFLATPGPTPLPPSVIAAMTMPMINHRSPEFVALFHEVVGGLKKLFGTEQPVYLFPGSGTGGWEVCLTNFVNPGEKVLSLSTGDFGDRFVKAAKALGYQTEVLETEWGQAVDVQKVRARLAADTNKEIKALLITHNETSTGVTNDIKGLAALCQEHGAISLIDSVSGLAALPLEFDAWGLDVVFTGSQKALAIPPGLLPVAVSKRAWAIMESVKTPRHYFDLRHYAKGWDTGTTPYTPAISLWYALHESLRLIEEEGRENVWARHQLLGEMCRAGVRAMGLKLMADHPAASNAVTAIWAPEGLSNKDLRKTARKLYGVELAGGQGKVADTVFRIGHLGAIAPHDVIAALNATELTLAHHGLSVKPGSAAGAALQVWLKQTAR